MSSNQWRQKTAVTTKTLVFIVEVKKETTKNEVKKAENSRNKRCRRRKTKKDFYEKHVSMLGFGRKK